MTDLDLRFGTAIDPEPNSIGVTVYPWEQAHAPTSLHQLDAATAHQLKALMAEVQKDFRVSKVLINEVAIIWVVDVSGRVWFAVEELFYEQRVTGLPRFQSFEPVQGIPKLGHPALILAGKGRIAGEIYFDVGTARPAWRINNRSGRYGRHSSRIFRHLQNVANEFRSFGIELAVEFY